MQQQFAAEAAYEMLTGDFGAITGPKWIGYHLQLRDAQIQLYRLELVPWRRWANGFSCLFFVMVGAPLAIRLRNADIWTSFGVVLPADPAALLSPAHVLAGSRQMRSLAALQHLAGQPRAAGWRLLADLPSAATLTAFPVFSPLSSLLSPLYSLLSTIPSLSSLALALTALVHSRRSGPKAGRA